MMDLSNLGRIASATSAYAADYEGQMWSYSWKKGSLHALTRWPDLQITAGGDVTAAGVQAVDLFRRKAGRPPEDFPPMPNWLPHLSYSHLVLLDHMDAEFPNLMFVSSGDRERLKWALDWRAFDENAFAPCQPDATNTVNRRWPYSASFQLPFAWYDHSNEGSRIGQTTLHTSFVIPGLASLGPARLADVDHPSAKVMLHDAASWHVGRKSTYFALPHARVPMLMSDGSADVRVTADANEGWMPNIAHRFEPSRFNYTPQCWEADAFDPSGVDSVVGHYRWTRSGLRGRDFGGPEFR